MSKALSRNLLLLCLAATLVIGFGCRKAEEPVLPEFTVVLAGADDHGKTTLLAAITQVLADRGLAEKRGYDDLVQASSSGAAEIDYVTGGHRVVLSDHGGHGRIVAALGDDPDVVLLVVGQAEGVTQQTREQIAAAAGAGRPAVVVFLSKGDLVDDEELRALVLSEAEQVLVEAGLLEEENIGTWEGGGYQPGQTTAFSGSALRALQGDGSALATVASVVDAVDRLAAAN